MTLIRKARITSDSSVWFSSEIFE